MKINELKDLIISAPPAPPSWRTGHSFKVPFVSNFIFPVTDHRYVWPFTTIWKTLKPKNYLVIGVLYGSTESYAMWKTGHKPDRIVACDVDLAAYNSERNTLASTYENLTKDNDNEVIIIRCNSRKSSAMENLGPYDLVFVDGEHTAKAVIADLDHAKKSLAPGGIVMVHDLELDSSSVLEGYNSWLESNKDFNHVEISKKHFQLGLGLIQRG